MLVTKSSVIFKGFTRELVEILDALTRISELYPYDIVITSAADGKHMKTSKHYTYQALDVRSKYFTKAEKQRFKDLLAAFLGKKYLVLLENEGQPNEHFHVELN